MQLREQYKHSRSITRPCRLNPKLSAYASLEGIQNYNAHHVVPFGIDVTVPKTANQRSTWVLSSVEGWYIGPTLEHYQYYK
eukprot:5170255-Ditylum_brightwellii.AAC.1